MQKIAYEKRYYYNNNYNILKICDVAKKKKSKLIHFSSTSIYGKSVTVKDYIDYYLKPQSPYAQIKFKSIRKYYIFLFI